MAFWSEWEPPSEQVAAWSPDGTLPKSLVRPHFPGSAVDVWPSAGAGLPQNTDPNVFGDSFKYALCKQFNQPKVGQRGRSGRLARLRVGTLILFGSTLNHEFVLDTVLVVGSTHDYTPATWQQDIRTVTSKTYRDVTFTPARSYDGPEVKEIPMRLYTGATSTQPVNGMFSYFPCLPVVDANTPPRFRRPSIRLDHINPKSIQSSKSTELSPDDIRDAWECVRDQVVKAGLMLGVAAEEPAITALPEHVWPPV